jgi:hypothetical protein
MAVGGCHLAPADEWEADQAERLVHDEAYFEGLLAEWHRQVLAEDPRQKTLRLPHGALAARKAPDHFEVDDEEFLAWGQAGGASACAGEEGTRPPGAQEVLLGGRGWRGAGRPTTGEVLGRVRLVAGEARYEAVVGK